MYLNCITHSPISENEDFKIFLIEQNKKNPFIANIKNDNYRLIGNSFDAKLEDNRCLVKNNDDENLKAIISYLNENCVKISNSDLLLPGAKEAAVISQKNKNDFKNWNIIEKLIFNKKLKHIAFSKSLMLNYVSFFVVKKSIYDLIVNKYYYDSYESNNYYHTQKWHSYNFEITEHEKKDCFVLEYLEQNGYFIEPFDFTYEGLDNCEFMKNLIEIEREKNNQVENFGNIKISHDETYRVFSWQNILDMFEYSYGSNNDEIDKYHDLFIKIADNNHRVYLHKNDEEEYLERFFDGENDALMYSNFKKSLNLNNFNLIIDFNIT